MKIFLSYASEDRPQAEEIQLALAGAGHEVFFDRQSLPAGGDYHARIKASVDEAELFVFLISPDSVDAGGYTLTEMGYARARWQHPRGHVLPVLLRPTDFKTIPAYLKSVTVLEPSGNVAAEVVSAVARAVGGTANGGVRKVRAGRCCRRGAAGGRPLCGDEAVRSACGSGRPRRHRHEAPLASARSRTAQSGATAFQLQAGGRSQGGAGRHAARQPADQAAHRRRRTAGAAGRRLLQLRHRLPGRGRSHPRHAEPRDPRVQPGRAARACPLLPEAAGGAGALERSARAPGLRRKQLLQAALSPARSGWNPVRWRRSRRRAASACCRWPMRPTPRGAGRCPRPRHWPSTRTR